MRFFVSAAVIVTNVYGLYGSFVTIAKTESKKRILLALGP